MASKAEKRRQRRVRQQQLGRLVHRTAPSVPVDGAPVRGEPRAEPLIPRIPVSPRGSTHGTCYSLPVEYPEGGRTYRARMASISACEASRDRWAPRGRWAKRAPWGMGQCRDPEKAAKGRGIAMILAGKLSGSIWDDASAPSSMPASGPATLPGGDGTPLDVPPPVAADWRREGFTGIHPFVPADLSHLDTTADTTVDTRQRRGKRQRSAPGA